MAISQNNGDNRSWHLTPLVAMNDDQFGQWVELLEKRTGICLPPERKSFLLTSLSARMRELKCQDYETYYQYLMSGKKGDMEWEVLVDRLTVHETRFFRDEFSLRLISDSFLPKYLATNDDALRIWSVGCATGEEPYSLAMLLDDYVEREGLDRNFLITATDISLGSLAKALRGQYRNNRATNVPAEFAERYINRLDADILEVKPELRQKVSFAQFNVMKLAHARPEQMDIIYCQNLLIYFKRERRIAILEHLVKHLRPGGLLVLGAGEIINWSNPLIETVNFPSTLAFRRINEPAGEQS
ncbi:MAG: methyltransferase domain-containing protein [Gammaproteobacteria bacterium]|nr:methyltransferase domain-containing protein [Gammaproteobacteria bacterium]MDH5776661.1 methyltransferase domain-containing protein [Gammaproteobacteria bacterium]